MIYIDASPAVHHKAGLGRYTEELIGALTEDPARRGDYAAFYHDAATAKPSPNIASLARVTTPQPPYPWRLRALLAQLLKLSQDTLLLPPQHANDSPSSIVNRQSSIGNLFHATEHLLPRFKRLRTVFTLHDLIFRFFPQHHLPRNRIYLTLAMPLFLRRSDRIICVSQQTRRDVQRLYRVPDAKLCVIYEGVDPRFSRVTDPAVLSRARKRYQLPEHFILAVGTVEPRKNLTTLFEAYAGLLQDGVPASLDDRPASRVAPLSSIDLVVAGKQGWLVESTLRAVHERGLSERVQFAGYVADEDLPALYTLADVFAFPSVYEGFGLPPLEALACGTPVVCSDASSLPEVVGDAALLVAPTDAQGWTLALGRALTDVSLRHDLAERGPRQAARFTWADAARQTRAVYDELLQG
jgi:glycosyltransferase involved in cell wall biosynthesis